MEYIGPRPQYCAEHIELDPKSLYCKCRSPYQKDPGDNKGCKEVVLKEFGYCYKHFGDIVSDIVRCQDYDQARRLYSRIVDLLAQLEKEASQAKKRDGDLYQRKNKLIPKFQEMKRLATKAVQALESSRPKDDEDISPDELVSPFDEPVLDINVAVESVTSEDDDILSSPPESLSEEEMLDQLSA
jgi:hypothetical protein